MSPRHALESEIFGLHCIFILTILLFAGLILSFLTWVLRKDVSKVWGIYRGWLIMIPLIFGSIFLERSVAITFLTLLAGFGFKEYAKATGLYRDWGMTGLVYIGITAMGIIALMRDPLTDQNGWFGLFRTLPVFVITLILALPILRNNPKGQLQTVSLAILGFIYIGWMFGHTLFLVNASPAYGYLLYLLVAVQLNDVFAFTFGKLFGRHHLRDQISPNKTWEGSIGAFTISMILPWLLHFSFPHFGTLQLVLTGLIVGIGGQLGDLSMGMIKRDLGIKDMGVAIPGHGGVLDRINSLIFTAPLFLAMVNYFYGLYGIR